MARTVDFEDDKPARLPLSAHPAFPVLVGLWFAALLGLGTMVLPAVVLEQFAGVTGLTKLFPATHAPLSVSARGAFALLATLLGLVGGLVLARRVAHAQFGERPVRRRAPRSESPPAARRPLSVHEDLGEAAIAASTADRRPPIAGRRRSLAITDEQRPSDFLITAPLPGADAMTAPDLPHDEDPMTDRASDFDLPIPAELDTTETTLPAMPEPAAEPVPGPAAEANAARPAYVPPLDTRKPRAIAAPPAAAATPVPAEPVTAAPLDLPLDDLGMVQLAERLGRSLQHRLAAATPSEAADVAVPPPVVPEALRAFMDPAAEAPAPAAHEPAAVPPALQPFAFEPLDAEEDDDLDPDSFTLPLGTLGARSFELPATEDGEDQDEDADEAFVDGSFSSLLEMKNPFHVREEFVRIDEPEADNGEIEPAVVFPSDEPLAAEPAPPKEPEAGEATASTRPFDAPQHQPAPSTAPVRAPRAAPDPAETERALRAALTNLQRMSGAA